MSPVAECGSPPPAPPPPVMDGAAVEQYTSTGPVEITYTNGGGGSSDGRINGTAISGGSGGATQTPPAATTTTTTNGATDNTISQHNTTDREPVLKGLHLSNVVFEYGGRGTDDRFLTTSRSFHHSGGDAAPSFLPPPNSNYQTNDQQHFSDNFSSHPLSSVGGEGISVLPVTSTLPPLAPQARRRGTDSLLTGHSPSGQHNPPPPHKQPQVAGPNELFFGTGEQRSSSGVSHRDREERIRQLREKQQTERQHKLEELKEHARDWSEQALAAQRFREQQEAQRRQRLQELRSRDQDRRSQVEERRRYMEQADQQKREQAVRKNIERDQRLDTKRRNERSNIVFAFGSSTPRMLDPKETIAYWATRRATSISNVTLEGGSSGASNRRSSDCVDAAAAAATGAPDLARKRATSALGLDRSPNELRMSSSMYEVFHWTDGSTPHSTPQGDDPMSRSMMSSVARRRTDLHPMTPSLRESVGAAAAGGGKGRHRSPGSSRSGGVTPSSRPTSALSHASSTATAGSVALRQRTTPRKPRPMSIAGTAPSAADRPRSPATNRESRNRNMSGGSSSSSLKGNMSRAKSASGTGNDSPASGPRTPAAAAPRTPRTPGQVKAESNARRLDKSKAPIASAVARKTTPMASPTVEAKEIICSTPKRAAKPRAQPHGKKQTSESTANGEASTAPQAIGDASTEENGIVSTQVTDAASAQATDVASAQVTDVDSGQVTDVASGQVTDVASAQVTDVASAQVTDVASAQVTDIASAQVAVVASAQVADGASAQVADGASAQVADGASAQVADGASAQVLQHIASTQETEQASTIVTEQIAETSKDAQATTVTTETKEEETPPVLQIGDVNTGTIVVTTETSEEVVLQSNGVASFEESQGTNNRTTTTTTEVVSTNDVAGETVITEVTTVTSSGGVEEVLVTETTQASASVLQEQAAVEQNNKVNESVSSEGSTTSAATDKPVAGYATEEEYKSVLAEKRRLAREAKERELEMERKRQEEEAERERREEEDMLRLMEEQKKAEGERLQKAIEQADRDREDEQTRKEEEEKQRLEAERQEAERQKEAEEKLRREEEERLSRKSRVAAIMARTRSRGGNTTPNKVDSKTPSDENKSISEALLKANLTDSMIDKMSDSMIATSMESEPASSGVSSLPMSDFSQAGSDVSGQQPQSDVSSQGTIENSTADYLTSGASSMDQTTVRHDDGDHEEAASVDLLSSGVANMQVTATTEQSCINGNSLLVEETQQMDLLGSLNGHSNGVDNSNQSVDLLGSFDPFSPSTATDRSSTIIQTTNTDFEQIIDASQTKISNEDAINSNPPTGPFIAFEQNLNMKTTQDNTTVPDILL